MVISMITGAAFNAGGTAFGQSQALFYNYEPMVSAISSGYFSIGNAIADNGYAIFDALIYQTKDAILGRTSNPYNFTATDLLKLRKKQIELFGL